MAKRPERPPPPTDARSWFLPIAGLMVALGLAVSVPALTRAANEEPPAEPEPEVTALSIHSTPEGATATVDGEECTTPCELDVRIGEEIEVALHLDGHRDASERVTPTAEMEPLEVALAALPYVLALTVPEGATVTLDGRPVEDPTEIRLEEAPEAPLPLVVEQRGYQTFESTIPPSAFATEDERRYHALAVELEPRRTRRAPAAPTTPSVPEVVPANPF